MNSKKKKRSSVLGTSPSSSQKDADVCSFQEDELNLLNSFSYVSDTRCCDRTSFPAITKVTFALHSELYAISQSYKIHVKTLSNTSIKRGCVTIPEFLSKYVLSKPDFGRSFPIIYALLTSDYFNEKERGKKKSEEDSDDDSSRCSETSSSSSEDDEEESDREDNNGNSDEEEKEREK